MLVIMLTLYGLLTGIFYVDDITSEKKKLALAVDGLLPTGLVFLPSLDSSRYIMFLNVCVFFYLFMENVGNNISKSFVQSQEWKHTFLYIQ